MPTGFSSVGILLFGTPTRAENTPCWVKLAKVASEACGSTRVSSTSPEPRHLFQVAGLFLSWERMRLACWRKTPSPSRTFTSLPNRPPHPTESSTKIEAPACGKIYAIKSESDAGSPRQAQLPPSCPRVLATRPLPVASTLVSPRRAASPPIRPTARPVPSSCFPAAQSY